MCIGSKALTLSLPHLLGSTLQAIIHQLLAVNANLAADNDQGENALHKLAQNGFFAQVSALLPHKPALVDQPKAGGMLHMASQGNFVELVEVLQSNGADNEKADWQVSLKPDVLAMPNEHAKQ